MVPIQVFKELLSNNYHIFYSPRDGRCHSGGEGGSFTDELDDLSLFLESNLNYMTYDFIAARIFLSELLLQVS